MGTSVKSPRAGYILSAVFLAPMLSTYRIKARPWFKTEDPHFSRWSTSAVVFAVLLSTLLWKSFQIGMLLLKGQTWGPSKAEIAGLVVATSLGMLLFLGPSRVEKISVALDHIPRAILYVCFGVGWLGYVALCLW